MKTDYFWWKILQENQSSFLEKDQALKRFETFFEPITKALEVEYYGEYVGLNTGKKAYRLIVRQHEWENQGGFTWGVRVCDALPNAQWRAAWRISAASRLRKQVIIDVLPQFILNFYQAVQAVNKSHLPEATILQKLF